MDGADNEDHGATGRPMAGDFATDRNKIRSDCDAYLNQKWSDQALRITYDAPKFTVLSVSSIQDQTLDKVNDCDLWDNPANEKINPTTIDSTRYSQELRIFSTTGGPFEWLGGMFAFHEDSTFNYKYEIVSANMVYMNPITDVETDGAAIFGQGRVQLTDKFHATLGLRLDYQTSKGDLSDAVQGKSYSDTIDDCEFLPKGVLDYDVTENIMAYVSVARGYMPGGFDWGNTGTKETFSYDPEYTLNYEAGVKSTWFDNRFLLNLSAFYIKIDDKQVSQMHPTLAILNISNAAEAHSTGVELTVEARPAQGLSLFAGLGFNEAKFDEFNAMVNENNQLVQKDYSDNYLTYAPKYTYNLGVQYRSPMGIYGRVDFLGTGEFYGDAANQAKQDGYEIVNLRLGYHWKKLDISVWGENLFDEEYQTFLTPFSNTIVGHDGPPRCFGVTLAVTF
ncbi:TonB-dependent receptor [Desulfobacter curvatus]|uniref:TonB-dependent receptor n=1 Tax=Desulfobacter curvatus TaxID=2290 RepID=UPI00039DFD57|nr:TonB-dependent receptor [Desulfobacter curvatus]